MPSQSIHAEDAKLLAIYLVQPKSTVPIVVTSPAFAPGDPIPHVHSAFGAMTSPTLTFEDVPPGTKSLTLLLEDPDAPSPKPFIHWVLVNLPPRTPYLREALPPEFTFLPDYGDALQGKNSAGKMGYYGMKPPAGHAPHHYHFTVFAVDGELTFGRGETVDRAAVLEKLKGRVLAMGDLIGTFVAPK